MSLTSDKINKLLFFKLPSAYWCGVRTKALNGSECQTSVTFKWINQNPFKSMYFAVQAMAAELSTGALCMYHLDDKKANVSMLVASCRSVFTKKAVGKIVFSCQQGNEVAHAIDRAIQTGEGVTCTLVSIGKDEVGHEVSRMEFDWTFKKRSR